MMLYRKGKPNYLLIVLLTILIVLLFSLALFFSQRDNISKTPTVISVTTTKPKEVEKKEDNIEYLLYSSEKLGLEIPYPESWGIREDFDVDNYESRKDWVKNATIFSHDKYSKVDFYSDSENRRYDVINDFSVFVYQNPDELLLDEFFKGYTEYFDVSGVGTDYPEDTNTSEAIKNGIKSKFGSYDCIIVPDKPYSDVGNYFSRKIYIKNKDKIFSLWFGHFVTLYLDSDFVSPKEVDDFIKIISDGFVIY